MYQAWRLFRRGKKPSKAIELFTYYLETNLLQLTHELQSATYQHGKYWHFMVNDSKRRNIAVATVRDRVVHRLVYEYLVVICDKQFAHHVWSCRQNKGLLGGIQATQRNMRRYRDGWVWRGDVRRFFDSIDHSILLAQVQSRVPGERLYSIVKEIIGSYSCLPGKGLAIGNLTSQILANVYLNEFDRFVLHSLKPLGYVRYGDDFMLWFQNEQAARYAATEGERFLRGSLALELQPSSTVLQPTSRKIHYLGLDFFGPHYRLDTRVVQRINQCANWENAASYESLLRHHMRHRHLKRYAWQRAGCLHAPFD